jgi:hypothetical protein
MDGMRDRWGKRHREEKRYRRRAWEWASGPANQTTDSTASAVLVPMVGMEW